jgi:peroxiredoxin
MAKEIGTMAAGSRHPGFLVAALVLLGGALTFSADSSPDKNAKKIADFTLNAPLDKAKVSLGDFKDKKAVVVVFVGTECPINNAYLPVLVQLYKEYGDKGTAFLAINSNRQDSPERIAEHARKHDIPFPVLKDPGNKVADLLGATRTPQAFVLDAQQTIRYQGRIDDQYGIGIQRPKPSKRELRDALEAVLSGQPVPAAQTEVAGCLIGRLLAPQPQAKVTFTQHVAPILQKSCQECHRPGQIGPMALLTYEDAAAWGETIREVVGERRMPPWFVDPKFGKFGNDRRLSDEDRQTILTWVEQGCPEGDAKYLPKPREFPEGWRLGKPDLIVTMPVEYDVPATTPRNGIPYKHFTVDPGFTEDRWVVQSEAHAGAPAVVHHVVVFIVPPGKKFNPDDPTNIVLGGMAPGDVLVRQRAGMAKRIPANSKLVFQIHYTPNGTAQKDRSSIGLTFAKEPPRLEVMTVPIFNLFFRIPPGADNHRVESWFTFERDGYIIGCMPHMHLRGKDFLYEAIYPDGTRETLLSVPRWSFLWQSVYRFEKPHPMPAGSKVHCIAHFDNSDKNPNNPDPTKAVFWGDQTWEEMMIGWMDYAYEPEKK